MDTWQDGGVGEGFPAQLGWRECVDCGSENSEEDLKGADVTLVTFFFFKLGFQKQARGNYKWLYGEMLDKILGSGAL